MVEKNQFSSNKALSTGTCRVNIVWFLFRISSWVFESESEFFSVEAVFGGLSGYSDIFTLERGHVVGCIFCKKKYPNNDKCTDNFQKHFHLSLVTK